MKLIFTSYVRSPEYNDPEAWLRRIKAWKGILENLARDNAVIGIERINYEGEYEQNGVHYHFIRLKKNEIRFPWHMHRLIKELRPDVVFVSGFIFPLQIIQLGLKLGRGVKIIVINHAERPFTGVKKFLQRLADRCVHGYFFTSKEMGEEWVQKGIISKESKIAEVMEVSSCFYVMNKEGALARTGVRGNPVFLWVGRLDSNKDPLTILKGFKEFIKYQPSARFYMIYHTEDLKQEIAAFCEKESDLQKVITMVGKIAHEEMQYWYSSADFIISGSHYESGGAAVCEAMSCGCIPVLTNIQAFRKITGPGKCGLLYEPGNDKALLDALLETQKMDIKKERGRVLQQFKEELSFEAIAGKINKAIAFL